MSEATLGFGQILKEVAPFVGEGRPLPPVERWNPPYCGDIDMEIARDGTWSYLGTPIRRAAMVRLFSTILRREDDGRFVLVTPAERVGIRVADAPFLAVTMEVEGAGAEQALAFTTNVGDRVRAGRDHPLRFEIDGVTGEVAPYVHVRGRLEARLARPVYYEIAELGTESEVDGERWFGVWSGGVFFPMIAAGELGS